MRTAGLFTSLCTLCTLLVATAAEAQQPPPPPKPDAQPPGPSRSSTQYTMRREEAGGADAEVARSRARGGDCAGALPSFDAAIKSTVDPGLRRDRGFCHEKLGHPYPAIEDYRAYVAALPEAPDADQIRQRLAALEGQAPTTTSPTGNEPGGMAGADASISVGGSASGRASASSGPLGPKSGEPERSFDYYVEQEKLADMASVSPLRNGTGFVLGPFLHMPRFFIGEGARGALAYGAGATFRYATGPTVTIISELGFAGLGVAGRASSQSGPLLLGGVELRLPVSRFASDHILLRGGVGYERPVVSGTRSINNVLLGRFAVGYRHVWGPSIGLEFLFDGGPAYFMPESAPNRLNGVLGGSLAFVVGF